MRLILLLLIQSILFSSCFTSNLLHKETKVSAIPSGSYSFTRAYYSNDSLLHLDFKNNESRRKKTNYYGITIDINAILNEYTKSIVEPVYFDKKLIRKYNAMSATSIIRNCTCPSIFNFNAGVLINFKEIRVNYFSTLPAIADSCILKGTDTEPANCCWLIDDVKDDDMDVAPVNTPTTIFIIPVADSSIGYVALRFPLKDHTTKVGVLPLTILADIVTSPIQLVGLVIADKLNSNDNCNNNSTTKSYHQKPEKKVHPKDKKPKR